MAETMQAAVVTEFGQPLELREVPIPEPGPNDILVKTETCGVCHSDLHARQGDWPFKPKLPLIPGHEGIGYVAKIGSNVKNVKEGDLVGVPWLGTACGHCDHCLGGNEVRCNASIATGYFTNGAFADYCIGDPDYVGRIPSGTNLAEMAPILCAGVTTYRGLKRTEIPYGGWVAISGIGGLGHMAVQYARAMGFHVAAVDIDDTKLAHAKELGAEITINAKNEDPGKVLRKAIGGAHGVLVTAVSEPAFAQALTMARKGGTVVFNGMPAGSVPLYPIQMVGNELTIRGSSVGTRLDLAEAIAFAAQGAVHSTVETDKLENINKIFDRMIDGTITGRVVLDFN